MSPFAVRGALNVKILTPADSAREAAILIEAGADSVYFGYIPASWLAGHSAVESFNRRTFSEAQITSLAEAAELIEVAGRRNVATWAAFNAAYYPPWMYDTVMKAARDLSGAGVTGFIVSDLALIRSLAEEGLGRLSLSTMGGAFNSLTVRFYQGLGIERVTVPRELSAAQVTTLAGDNPGMLFDVFVLFGACANIEPFCRWVHDDPGRVWPCVKEYRPLLPPAAGPGVRSAAAAQRVWCGLSRTWACGLCALRDLSAEANVDGLKIVGRGAPTERKLTGVRTLRRLLTFLEADPDRTAWLSAAKAAKLEHSGSGCHPYLCYFPEFL